MDCSPFLVVTPKNICAYVGEKEARFYSRIREQQLPAWQSGQRQIWKAMKSDLDLWIDRQREKYLKL